MAHGAYEIAIVLRGLTPLERELANDPDGGRHGDRHPEDEEGTG